ncbi:hypothetical protein HaLaN_10404, partial [Haematococcus lacustris]
MMAARLAVSDITQKQKEHNGCSACSAACLAACIPGYHTPNVLNDAICLALYISGAFFVVETCIYQTPLAHRVVRVEAEGVNNVLR